jgi:hypothetical protein
MSDATWDTPSVYSIVPRPSLFLANCGNVSVYPTEKNLSGRMSVQEYQRM